MYNKDKDNEKVPMSEAKIVVLSILALVILVLAFSSFYQVNAGQRAVLLTFGNPNPNPMGQGLHFMIPIVQNAVIMNVQTQVYTVQNESASSQDLQEVTTDIAVNYHINPENVVPLYTNVGADYQNVVITPAVAEVMKASTAKYSAEQLIEDRSGLVQNIQDSLSQKLGAYNIIVDSISITNFQFSPDFQQAVEAKVVAYQNALAANNTLMQKQIEAQQILVTATAQAQANQLLQQSATSGVVALQALQIEQQAIAKWNGQLPQVTGNAIPFLNMNPTTPTTTTANTSS